MARKKAEVEEFVEDPGVVAERNAKIADEAAQCKESLKKFFVMGHHVIGLGGTLVDGWHIDCLCEHMEALLRRQIRKLIINISPRSDKSTILSVAGPSWWWTLAAP